MERTEIRIVAGQLRGRKLVCHVHEGMRPTPQMVREALFSILGNAVPDRIFYDLFAGTGVNGIEAISRGASQAQFLERDAKLATSIEKHIEGFGIREKAMVVRTDVYRWAERWVSPAHPVNVFISPPFADLKERLPQFLGLVQALKTRMLDDSVLVLQVEDGFDYEALGDLDQWDIRQYGRNMLLFWVKEHESALPDNEDDA